MKTNRWFLILTLSVAAFATEAMAQPASPPPAPAAPPAPPPAAPPKRSAAELEKLAAPIALYPDPLIAILLPAAAYPVEIVQAARFIKDTNNLPNLEEQPWDSNVKDVAMVPDLIAKMDGDLDWTIKLGQAFVDQPKDLMDTIQALRAKAQKAGTLQNSPQQVVIVTNTVVEKTIEQRVVVVTNTIVQIQPANPQVVYVPTYNPYTVYYPPPAYVYNPYAPLVTFAAGVAVGAIIANNCDWHGGGVYVGPHGAVVWSGGSYHGDVNVNRNVNVNNNYNQNINNNYNRNANVNQGNRPTTTAGSGAAGTKWQPDQNRMRASGAAGASAGTMESRGWGSSGARPATGSTWGGGSSAGAGGTRPATGAPSASRPTASPSVSRPSPSASRPAPSASPSYSRPSGGSGGSAFGGMSSGASSYSSSSRGAASRGSSFSGGGFSGGGRGGGFSGGGGGGRR
jgi:hypothetical protein